MALRARFTTISRRSSGGTWTPANIALLHAAPPRSGGPEHGALVVKLPWAGPSSRFTALFEALAIEWLKAASQKAVAKLLQLSWDEIHGIMERAVERGLRRRQAEPVPQIGVDEKAFRKGHHYFTLANDLVRGRVLHVAEDRKQSSLDGFWGTLTAEQIDGISALAMDMWESDGAGLGFEGNDDGVFRLSLRTASPQALSLVA